MVGQLDKILPGKETFTRAQSSLADLLERQPLLLGAIGLAVGAAVAGAFRASDLENEWVGVYSDSVKEDLNERAGAVSQSVREAADTLKDEIKDAGTETFDRVKQAGMDAAEAAGRKVTTLCPPGTIEGVQFLTMKNSTQRNRDSSGEGLIRSCFA
jgi:hypothetical protein